LITKKRYVGSLYTYDPESRDYIDKKGVALKRRDFCKLVKEVFEGVLKCFFDQLEPDKLARIEKAKRVVIKAVDDLLNNRVPFEKLILSRLLKDEYKVRDSKNVLTKNKYRFNDTNLKIKDVVQWIDPELGLCDGVIVKKRKIKVTSDSFFGVCTSGGGIKRRKIRAPLTVAPKKCQIVRIDTNVYTSEPHPLEDEYMEMKYEDISAREGYMISLDKIRNAKTSKSELDGVKQAHVRLARRMYLRDRGSAPDSGTRVQFVYVERDNPKALQHEKSEDPDYAKKNNLNIDPAYYLERQLKRPIVQLFSLIMRNPEKMFDEPLKRYLNGREKKQSGQKDITMFFKSK